jgi:hypothetical protein
VPDRPFLSVGDYELYGAHGICPLAATTLLFAGFEVSTFDLVVLPFVGVDAFLFTRDFFSMAILVSPKFFDFYCRAPSLIAIEVPNFFVLP